MSLIFSTLILPHRTAVLLAMRFCTPIRPRPSKLSTPSDMPPPRLREVPLTSGAVRTYEWGDPARQPTILLVHGWNGWALQFAGFVLPLLSRGFAVIAFDHRGHGHSTGQYVSLPVFIRTLSEFVGSLPMLKGVIGHSLGAAAVASVFAHLRASGVGLVLIAPLTRSASIVSRQTSSRARSLFTILRTELFHINMGSDMRN